MSYPQTIRPILFEVEIDGVWVDLTSRVLEGTTVTVQRGQGGEDNTMPPTTLTADLNNEDGHLNPDNPVSPYWPHLGQNVRARWTITDNSVGYVRFDGEVPSWPVEYRSVAADSIVSITAAGLFRRWEQGQPLISPLRRSILAADTLVAYCPMEDDGANAQTLASAIPGRPGMNIVAAVDVAAYSGFVGSKPVPQVGDGRLAMPVAAYTAVGNQNVLFLARGAVASIDLLLVIINISSGSVAQVGVLAHTNGDLRMRFYDNEGAIITTSSYAGTHNINDKDCLVRIILANDGTDVDWRLGVIDQDVIGDETVTTGTVASRQIGRISALRFDGVGVPVGHATVCNGDPTNLDVIAFDAFPAYTGETCADRFVRVCHENAVAMRVVGNSDTAPRMGPQPIGTLKQILQECADTSHGMIVETRDELGVTMILLDALANQTSTGTTLEQEHPVVAGSVFLHVIRIAPAEYPHFWPGVTFTIHEDADGSLWEATVFTVTSVVGDLDNNSEIGVVFDPPAAGLPTTAQHARIVRSAAVELDYSAHEISRPFRPVRDDRATVNELTLSRRDGSEYTARQDTGPRSVQDPPNGIGLYSKSETLSLWSDGQLAEHAEWMLAGGTLNRPRLPNLEVGLHRGALASRQADLLDLDIGHKVTVVEAAAAHFFDPIQQLCRGYTEVYQGARLHQIVINGVPADLHNVLTFDSGDRWAAESTVLGEAITTTQTGGIDVAVGQEVWTTDPADFPLDIMIGGERVTLSDINGSAGTITFVGVGTAATADNAPVTATLPVGAATGDTVLLLASIRNTGATVNTPTNWTVAAQIGTSTKLLSREYDGVWSMPAVSFTSGVSGDSTIAQSAAFTGVGTTVAVTNTAVTTTTSDDMVVSTNAMGSVAGQYGLRLAFAVKYDDWTSVEPPAGLTELQESDTTTGLDIGQTWAYAIDSRSADFPGGSGEFTVTGGGSAWYQTMVVFFAAEPQEFVISARSVNGVVKAHSPGAVINVAEPSYYGLGG